MGGDQGAAAVLSAAPPAGAWLPLPARRTTGSHWKSSILFLLSFLCVDFVDRPRILWFPQNL